MRRTAGSTIPAACVLPVLLFGACGGGQGGTAQTSGTITVENARPIDVGERPRRLATTLPAGPLRDDLLACDADSIAAQPFSIGHRGAPLGYPEHTRESYLAAARQGAGLIECDVTFTTDDSLVCRHSQCDLHSSTDILETPLVERCSVPPDFSADRPFADVMCCTSDLTLGEFRTLQGRHDVVDPAARDLSGYYAPAARRTVSEGPDRGTLMSHADSIALFDALGVAMIPELKATLASRGAERFPTRQELADRLVADYAAAGIDPARVHIQSFEEGDLSYLRTSAPAFAERLVLLDDRYLDEGFDPLDANSWVPSMQDLSATGLTTLAPPVWVLLTLDDDGEIVPSPYALAARSAGLELVTWTLERSGTLEDGGGFYYQSISRAIDEESDLLRVLDVLARDVGVRAVFSDWPATTTWYAHCRSR